MCKQNGWMGFHRTHLTTQNLHPSCLFSLYVDYNDAPSDNTGTEETVGEKMKNGFRKNCDNFKTTKALCMKMMT